MSFWPDFLSSNPGSAVMTVQSWASYFLCHFPSSFALQECRGINELICIECLVPNKQSIVNQDCYVLMWRHGTQEGRGSALKGLHSATISFEFSFVLERRMLYRVPWTWSMREPWGDGEMPGCLGDGPSPAKGRALSCSPGSGREETPGVKEARIWVQWRNISMKESRRFWERH